MKTKPRANEVDAYVGKRIRACRLMQGMSQTGLASSLGITFQQVQKYENGKNRLGSSRLQQASNALGVPVSYFFDGAPGSTKVQKQDGVDTAFFAIPGALDLAKAFAKIADGDARRQVVRMTEFVAAFEARQSFGKRKAAA